jgi:hypothetical protein
MQTTIPLRLFEIAAFALLALAAVALTTRQASACSVSKPPTDEERFKNASAVFVAHLTKAEEGDALRRGSQPAGPVTQEPTVVGTFRVIEVLKGTPPEDRTVRDYVFAPGNCSLGLFPGIDYLFFLHGDNWVLWPGGSKGILNLQAPPVQQLLEKLRKLKFDNGK